MMKQPRTLYLIALVLYGVAVGVLPYALKQYLEFPIDPRKAQGPPLYPWNFSPATAIALFGACTMTDWRKALMLPLGMRLCVDLGILAVTRDVNLVWYPDQAFVYGCVLLYTGIGVLMRRENSPLYIGKHVGSAEWAYRIGAAGFAAELMFFIVTNFATWALTDTYAHSAYGLQQCFMMAIPFFGRSLASTLFYCGVLFGGYTWLENRESAKSDHFVREHIE